MVNREAICSPFLFQWCRMIIIRMISVYKGVLWIIISSTSVSGLFEGVGRLTSWLWDPPLPKRMLYTLYQNEYLESNFKPPAFRRVWMDEYLKPNKILFDGRLNTTNPTKILLEGWKTDHKMRRALVDAYLENGARINVIAVDWKYMYSWGYISARRNTHFIALRFAEFLEKLSSDYHLDLRTVHVVAHSLGAQIAGLAAYRLKAGLRIGRLTALEPVKLFFNENIVNATLSRRSAKLVDVIHTSFLGLENPIGHMDFYVNGGKTPQPGCMWEDMVFGKCSHSRSYSIFAETIRDGWKFLAIRCGSYEMFKEGNCGNNTITFMGEWCPSRRVPGVYYIDTSDQRPFGLGCQGILKEGSPWNYCRSSPVV